MRRSDYVLQKECTATCPTCHNRMELLIHRTAESHKPIFFICWTCKAIGQAGIGKVERED